MATLIGHDQRSDDEHFRGSVRADDLRFLAAGAARRFRCPLRRATRCWPWLPGLHGTPTLGPPDIALRRPCSSWQNIQFGAMQLVAAPMRATGVKRAWGIYPVTCVVSPGWPDCSPGSSSAAAWFTSPCGRGQAGAPAAAQRRGRTSLRPTNGDGFIESEEGSFRAGFWGSGGCPRRWLAEWSRKHPSGVSLCDRADAMTMCSGTGLLSQMIERGRWPAHAAGASVPGAW